VIRTSFTTLQHYLIRVVHGQSFIFVVYGFDLLVKVWFVGVVLVLEFQLVYLFEYVIGLFDTMISGF
jgi:hypothetical protein